MRGQYSTMPTAWLEYTLQQTYREIAVRAALAKRLVYEVGEKIEKAREIREELDRRDNG